MFETIEILPGGGELQLLKYCADDLDVVNAAKVSMHKYSDTFGEHESNLIRFLHENDHGSPFEHNYFKFRVRAPISVAREWVRHRIGIAWNEESGRYVELRPNFYVPGSEQMRGQVGKPGSYTFDRITDEKDLRDFKIMYEDIYEECYNTYRTLIGGGVAKELARLVLPVGIYTEWIWSCNARSLMAFLTLRNAPDAQEEIRMYAEQLENIFNDIMPVTSKYFRENR